MEKGGGRLQVEQVTANENLAFEKTGDGTLLIRLQGAWRMQHGMPSASRMEPEFRAGSPPRRVAFEAAKLAEWDSSLLTFVWSVSELCIRRGIEADITGLPPGLRNLLELAEAVHEKKDDGRGKRRPPLIERVGRASVAIADSLGESLGFIGQVAIAFGNLARRKARYRISDLLEAVQECGANALGIVTLISFLVGVILAFMGAVQLQQFGAQIYVADLVAIGMVREMGAMMTAIIMAGRTGSAFAARIGTMKVTEEIDALATMGISPMQFLVLPRIIALTLMMPLLCLYSDFMGIIGGAAIGAGMLGLSPAAYLRESVHAVHAHDLLGGLFKSLIYGILIAFAGCLCGFQCGNSSAAVGDATTRSVVMSMVLIVISCGIFAVVFNILKI